MSDKSGPSAQDRFRWYLQSTSFAEARARYRAYLGSDADDSHKRWLVFICLMVVGLLAGAMAGWF